MPAAIPLEDMLEKDWQKQVRQLAETLGYRRAYHTFDSRRSDTGFPDLVLVSAQRKRVVYLELKREKGKVSERQAEWIRDLDAAGAEVYIVRPRHIQALAVVLGGHSGYDIATYAVARGILLQELDAITTEKAA